MIWDGSLPSFPSDKSLNPISPRTSPNLVRYYRIPSPRSNFIIFTSFFNVKYPFKCYNYFIIFLHNWQPPVFMGSFSSFLRGNINVFICIWPEHGRFRAQKCLKAWYIYVYCTLEMRIFWNPSCFRCAIGIIIVYEPYFCRFYLIVRSLVYLPRGWF